MTGTLNGSSYYSHEADKRFFSFTQIKRFEDCPARAVAVLNGEWNEDGDMEKSTALLVGSYVDAAFEGTLEQFKAEHPTIFKKDGTLKAEYVAADRMIERARRDKTFMAFMEGEKQAIRTGMIDGYPFKVKIDVLGAGRIVDLKTARDFAGIWSPEDGRKLPWVEARRYTLQGAIYQAIEGGHKPFYIAAISKEAETDLQIVEVEQGYLDAELQILRDELPLFDAYKNGWERPRRCEKCAYCKRTREQVTPIKLSELEE